MSKKIFNYCLLFSAISSSLYSKDLTINYVVKKGDTLNKIAKKYKTTVDNLLESNKLNNPNLIYPGMNIKIDKKLLKSDIKNNSNIKNELYTIKKGDTLSKIAKKYKINLEELLIINNLTIKDIIYPGQRLKIEFNQNNKDRYIVRKNDTLAKIAEKNKTTVEDILKSNSISNPNMIYPNQVLLLDKKVIEENNLEENNLEEKILKIETNENAYLEIYYKGEIIGYKNSTDKEILNVVGNTIKTGEEFLLKSYNQNGNIEEKSVKITPEEVTFISFIDKNKNKELDIEDELITDGQLEILDRKIQIDSSGKTKISNLEMNKNYNLKLISKEKNLINKNFDIKIDNKTVYIPIEDNLYTIKGKINISNKKKLKYENLIIRLKSEFGEDISLFLVDTNGEFLIEELPKGNYKYDIEYIDVNSIKELIKNKDIIIDKDVIEISL